MSPQKPRRRRSIEEPVKKLPDFIAENFDENFQREYSQLAVALGGALP
jgi:hypothetical protein